MTTNNKQGMTDETIREEIANHLHSWNAPGVFNLSDRPLKLQEWYRNEAAQILSLISQHSASQEAEIKRLKEENQKRIEEIFSTLDAAFSHNPDIDSPETHIDYIYDVVESLKKLVRGDGT